MRFDNERAIDVLVAAAAAIVPVVTVLNVSSDCDLVAPQHESRSRHQRDRTEATRLRQRGGWHSPESSTRTSWRWSSAPPKKRMRSSSISECFRGRNLQSDRGDDSARRDADFGLSIIQRWRDERHDHCVWRAADVHEFEPETPPNKTVNTITVRATFAAMDVIERIIKANDKLCAPKPSSTCRSSRLT